MLFYYVITEDENGTANGRGVNPSFSKAYIEACRDGNKPENLPGPEDITVLYSPPGYIELIREGELSELSKDSDCQPLDRIKSLMDWTPVQWRDIRYRVYFEEYMDTLQVFLETQQERFDILLSTYDIYKGSSVSSMQDMEEFTKFCQNNISLL